MRCLPGKFKGCFSGDRNRWLVSLPLLGLVVVLSSSTSLLLAKDKKNKHSNLSQMQESKRAVHALNRLSFGPQPGEVQRVQQIGVDKWIEQQLHPEKIDDSALEARLAPLRTLKMDTRAMVENFPPPQVLKAVAEGRMSMPSDPMKRAIYTAGIEQYKAKQERKQEIGKNATTDMNQGDSGAAPAKKNGDPADPSMDPNEDRRQARMELGSKIDELVGLSPDQRLKLIVEMSPQERRRITAALKPEEREMILNQFTPQQRETVVAMINPQQVVAGELQQGKMLRAIYSQRQLEEVMTDFWFNHFNVFIGKGPDRYMITAYERDVIRPRVFGKFKDLLMATAESPAMLFYLDNALSVGPNSDFAKYGGGGGRQMRKEKRESLFGGLGRGRNRGGFPSGRRPNIPGQNPQRPQQNQQAKNRRGLNENYARELMELHTLGVNGGYTQKDVTEVARVFTGWTIREPRRGGGFEFNERMHEPGSKMVLGKKIKEGGESEGKKVLELLARHPSTARFISSKLAQRFVSDTPPRTLIDRMAETYQRSDGEIREVLRTMFKSPEFWAPESYRAKVKTPLEFVVSAARASGAEVSNAQPLMQNLQRMGMPLYGAQPPAGYSMRSDAWVNSAALLSRMNFALALGAGRLPGVSVEPRRLLGRETMPSVPDQALAMLENALLAGDVSKQTHDTIRKQLGDVNVTGRLLDDAARSPNTGVIAGLILGSPEFQRR